MQARSTLITWILLLSVGVGRGEERVLQIVDKLVAGSPVGNVGSTTFSVRSVDGGRLAISHLDDWTAKNMSQKPIVAMVESLVIRDDNGVLIDRKAQYDAFFHPQVIDPGKTVPFSQDYFGEHIMDPRYQSPIAPSAEVIVRWVQFLDGTTFGDSSYAEQLLADRAAVMTALKHLREVYITEGPEKFSEQLKQRASTPVADAYINHIRTVQQKRGTQVAIDTLMTHLSVGEARPGLNGTAP
jgi:hypothetical protein